MQVIPALQPVLFQGGGIITPEARTLFAAMTIQPTYRRKKLIDNCIFALQLGGVWSLLDGLSVFAAADTQSALLNWKNPGTFNFTNGVAPTFAVDQGYTGNGTTMWLTNTYNLSTSGGQYARDSATAFAWCNTTAQDASPILGTSNGTSGPRLYPRFTDDKHYYRINSTLEFSIANTEGKGFYSTSRTGASALIAYKNGAQVGTDTTASLALPSDTIAVLVNGVNFFSGQVMCAGWGSQLTAAQHAALYDALHNYLIAVARIV